MLHPGPIWRPHRGKGPISEDFERSWRGVAALLARGGGDMTGSAKADSVPAAELMRNFGRWQDRTAHGPVFVTNHGRPRVVLMSIEDYERIGHLPPAKAGSAM